MISCWNRCAQIAPLLPSPQIKINKTLPFHFALRMYAALPATIGTSGITAITTLRICFFFFMGVRPSSAFMPFIRFQTVAFDILDTFSRLVLTSPFLRLLSLISRFPEHCASTCHFVAQIISLSLLCNFFHPLRGKKNVAIGHLWCRRTQCWFLDDIKCLAPCARGLLASLRCTQFCTRHTCSHECMFVL